jgi:hypothetical protein
MEVTGSGAAMQIMELMLQVCLALPFFPNPTCCRIEIVLWEKQR